jgi:hypothetical protein
VPRVPRVRARHVSLQAGACHHGRQPMSPRDATATASAILWGLHTVRSAASREPAMLGLAGIGLSRRRQPGPQHPRARSDRTFHRARAKALGCQTISPGPRLAEAGGSDVRPPASRAAPTESERSDGTGEPGKSGGRQGRAERPWSANPVRFRAINTASTRLRAFSFCMTSVMWCLTVFSAILRLCPISRFIIPIETSSRT